MKKVIIAISFIIFLSSIALAQDYVVIVNPSNSASEISSAMLKRLYTGRASDLNGTMMVPINQTLTAPLGESFVAEVIGQSAVEFQEFWVAKQIQGAGSAPMVQGSDAAVISMVSTIPGAIGYVSPASVTPAVKVISVN